MVLSVGGGILAALKVAVVVVLVEWVGRIVHEAN